MSAQSAWLRFWGLSRRYYRYEVRGLEHLLRREPVLIVGYHGRAGSYDLCMLSVELHERLGYLPHGVVHQALLHTPGIASFFRGIGAVAGDGLEIARAVAAGEHIVVTPGGPREATRPFWRDRYTVDWGERVGFLRLAARYGLPIVPVGASGVDDLALGLNDGYRLGKKLRLPDAMPAWIAWGMLGPSPIPVPFPVKIRQVVGAPIDVGLPREPSISQLRGASRVVAAAVQRAVDEALALASRARA